MIGFPSKLGQVEIIEQKYDKKHKFVMFEGRLIVYRDPKKWKKNWSRDRHWRKFKELLLSQQPPVSKE